MNFKFLVSVFVFFAAFHPNAFALTPVEAAQKIKAGDFATLESHFADLKKNNSLNEDGLRPLSQAYDKFPYEHSQLPMLDEWCRQYPVSHYARVMRGVYYIRWAGEARGYGYASTVTEKGAELYRERLLKAQADLEKASQYDSADAYALGALINVVARLGLSDEDFSEEERMELQKLKDQPTEKNFRKMQEIARQKMLDKIEIKFQMALNSDASDATAYLNKLEFLKPKWYGTVEEMLDFARKSAISAPAGSVIPLILVFAHFEAFKLSRNDGGSYQASENGYRYFSDPLVWGQLEGVLKRLNAELPDSSWVKTRYATAAFFAGKKELANQKFDEVTDYKAALWDDGYLSEALTRLGRTADLEKAYLDWQKAEPDSPEPHNTMAHYYKQTGNLEKANEASGKAAEILKKRLESDPKNLENGQQLGYALRDIDPDQAIAQLKGLLYETTAPAPIYLYLGYIYANSKKDYDQAFLYYSKVLETDPSNEAAHNGLGYVYSMTGKMDKAAEQYKFHQMLSPRDPKAHYDAGNVFFNAGKFEEALQEYLKAIELRPDYATAYYGAGCCYSRLNKPEEARSAYKKFLELGDISCPECVEFAKRNV